MPVNKNTQRKTPQHEQRSSAGDGWTREGWYRRLWEGARLRRWSQFHRGGNGVINFNRILGDLSAALALLAVPRLKVVGPTPQPGEQQAEQLQRLVDAINSALHGLGFVVAQAAVVATHVVLVG